jgi:hypothetical protein
MKNYELPRGNGKPFWFVSGVREARQNSPKIASAGSRVEETALSETTVAMMRARRDPVLKAIARCIVALGLVFSTIGVSRKKRSPLAELPFSRSHHVVPGMSSAFCSGNNMVEHQVFGAAAVLTGVVIVAKDFPTIHRRNLPVPLWIAARQTNVVRNL